MGTEPTNGEVAKNGEKEFAKPDFALRTKQSKIVHKSLEILLNDNDYAIMFSDYQNQPFEIFIKNDQERSTYLEAMRKLTSDVNANGKEPFKEKIDDLIKTEDSKIVLDSKLFESQEHVQQWNLALDNLQKQKAQTQQAGVQSHGEATQQPAGDSEPNNKPDYSTLLGAGVGIVASLAILPFFSQTIGTLGSFLLAGAAALAGAFVAGPQIKEMMEGFQNMSDDSKSGKGPFQPSIAQEQEKQVDARQTVNMREFDTDKNNKLEPGELQDAMVMLASDPKYKEAAKRIASLDPEGRPDEISVIDITKELNRQKIEYTTMENGASVALPTVPLSNQGSAPAKQ